LPFPNPESQHSYYLKNRERVLQHAKEYQKNHLAERLEYIKQYNREHPEKRLAAVKKYRAWNPQKIINGSNDYRSENSQKIADYRKRYDKNCPQQIKAELLGRSIPLASSCKKCGTTVHLERHHFDYSKPLEVITLCKRCHKETHIQKKETEGGISYL
jgi:hypothetical protein